MATLANGIETLEVGATAWRLIINANLEKLYTKTESDNTFLKKIGGTLTGFLSLHADPTSNLHAATKQYVDNAAVGGNSTVATLTNKTIDSTTNTVGADHVHYKVYNNTGSTILKGTVLKCVEYNAAEDAIRVAPTTASTDIAIGIAEANIAVSSYGLLISSGVIKDINTSSFSANTLLYSNGSGTLTSTKPTTGSYQTCGIVLKVHATAGALLVEFTEPNKANWDERYYTEAEIDYIMGSAGLLPNQTGNAGRYLQTNGTTASWVDVSFDPTDYLMKEGGTMTGAVTSFREAVGTVTGTNLDLATGNLFAITISGATALTVSNIPTTGQVFSFVLEITNGGSAAVTWFSGAKFAGGVAPTLTTSGMDLIACYTRNGGTTWNVLVMGKDVK